MTTILITIPFFAVIACGYVATRYKIINSAGRAGLNQFVYYFALPVLIFSLMAQADLQGEFQWTYVTAYGCVALFLFVTTLFLARLILRMKHGTSVVFATACIYGNTGYFGLPFVITAFGHEASVPVIICTTFDLAIMFPLASALFEKSVTSSSGHNTRQVFLNSILSVTKNPLIIATFLGALFSISGFQLPEVADRFIVLLATAAAPCALFALGSSMDEERANFFQYHLWVISLIKLVIHPLLIWYAMFHLFDVDASWGKSAIIAASMPVAVTAYILAQQYNTYVGRTAASILLSTVLSIGTLSFILNQLTGT